MQKLVELAQTSWDEFRARYHSQIDAMKNGDDGSMGSDGAGILQVRSGTQRVATSILSVTELLNGSGDIPDAESLLSSAVSADQSAEDFTCMVLSLMFLMDGIYLIHSGKKSTVGQMFNIFMNEKVPPITSESTPLRTLTLKGSTQSPGEVPVSKGGESFKSESNRMSRQRKKKKRAKVKSKRKTSGGRKAPSKKTRK